MTHDSEELTSINQQAAHWWVVLHNTNPSAAEKREFVEWVTRAPECVEASLRVARVHSAVSRSDVRWPATSAEELVRAAVAAPDDAVVPFRPHGPRTPTVKPRLTLRWVAGLAALVLIAVVLGWWFMPFAIGLVAGLLNRIASRRTRVALPAVLAAALVGWGLALGWLGRHGLPFAAVERVIAAVHGFPHSATAGVTVTLLVAAAQVTAGYWLGRALTPRPLDDWSA